MDEKRHQRSINQHVLCVLILMAFALAGSACKGGANKPGDAKAEDKSDAAQQAVPVEVAVVGERAVSASYSGTAPLEPRAESQVVAKTSGIALRVMAEEGQQVRVGQPLVKLDDDRLKLQAAQTSVQVRKLEASYRRASQLAEQRMVSASDLDQLRFDLENARAALRLVNLEQSYTNVVAPISGVVASRSIKPGNLVQINTPIFRIVDTSRLEATLNVPERELATMRAGQPVKLVVDAIAGKTFNGRVDRVAPVVDSGSGTFRVICAFDAGGLLQPGMFGRIAIDYDQRTNAMAIPRIALLDDDSQAAVYVLRGEKVVRTPLQTGYVDGEWVEVRGGLKLGDQVVTAGKSALRDGMSVQVLDVNGKVIGGVKPTPKPAAPK